MPRTLHRLLAGSAAALTAFATTALPASAAAPGGATVRLQFPDVAVAAEGDAKGGALLGWLDAPGATDDDPATVGGIRVSVDTADVADFASVVLHDDAEIGGDVSCGTAGTVLSCTLTGPFDVGADPVALPLAALRVTAKAGGKAGDTGQLAFTAQADDGPVATYRSTVSIGEDVDLAAVDTKPVTVAPGAQGVADLRVSNVGPRPVTGSVLLLFFSWSERLRVGDGFRNCTYGEVTVCAFDDVLAPGATYALSDPMRLRMPADAAAGSSAAALGVWFTTAEWAEVLATLPDGVELGQPGTGGVTRLEALASAAGVPQVDGNPDNNYVLSEVVVGGSRRTDMAAVGATVSGSAGDRVKARVGFVNNGPGTLYHRDFDNADPATHVSVPAGLEAVQVDDACLPLEWLEDIDSGAGFRVDADKIAGFPDYLCSAEADATKPQGRVLFDFTFEIKQASATPGRVTINEAEWVAGPVIDRNRRNDTAKILVDLAGDPGGPGDDSGGSGGGGGLPITGSPTAVVAGTGALLLLAGATGMLLVRRRRVRFTA